MKKKWNKKARKFINVASENCLAAVSWYVRYTPGDPKAKIKCYRVSSIEAELTVTEEARSHYIHRKADLRAIHNMQRELNNFEAACMQAFADKEEADAESKVTD